jgi:cell division protein FtsB
MKNVLRSLMFVAILGSFGEHCVAAQANQKNSPKIRISQLEERFAHLKASQDKQALDGLKQESEALFAEVQKFDDSNTAAKLKARAKTLASDVNATLHEKWPTPSLWARFKSTLSYAKTKADSAVKFVVHGSEEQRAKEAAQVNQNLAGIQQVLHNDDVVPAKPRETQAGLHITATEVSFHPSEPHLWELEQRVPSEAQPAVDQAPAAPAPLRIIVTDENGHPANYEEPKPSSAPAHDAGNAQPEPQAREITPLTPEEREKQNQELLAQAQKIIADHEKANKAEQADVPATAVNSGSMSMVDPRAPAQQAPDQTAAYQAKELVDYLTEYYENGTIEHLPKNASLTMLHKTLPSILGALRNHPESLETLARICFENRDKSREEFEKIIAANLSFQREITSVCDGFIYANTETATRAEAEKIAAHKEAVRLFYDYAQKLKSGEEQLRQKKEKAEVAEKRDADDHVEAPAAVEDGAAQVHGSQRDAALVAYLKDLQDVDQNITRKRVRKAIIDYFEDHPAELNAITHCIATNKNLANADIITAIQQLDAYNSFNYNCLAGLARQADLRLNQNPIVAGRQNFFKAAIQSGKSFRPLLPRKKASSWLKNVGIGSLIGGAAYGLYGLSKMYAGTTKSMIGYQSMSTIGSKLPVLWKGINALTFKVILPTVGIAAAGVICYACYRFYKHKRLSDQLITDKARSASDDCTQEELHLFVQHQQAANREAIRTAGEMLELGESIETVTGINPVQDHIDKQIGLQA